MIRLTPKPGAPLDPTTLSTVDSLVQARIDQRISRRQDNQKTGENLDWLAAHKTQAPHRVFLKMNTGMNRLGLRPEELKVLLGAMDRLKRLDVELVISHLACADEPDHPMNEAQLAAFEDMTNGSRRKRLTLLAMGLLTLAIIVAGFDLIFAKGVLAVFGN